MRIYHISLDMDDPHRTGQFLADMLGLNVKPFYLNGVNLTHPSGTSLELTPRHTTIAPSPELFQSSVGISHATSVHIALSSPFDREHIKATAARAGWMCQEATRGQGLPLIEVHVEGRYLFEIYCPEDRLLLEEFCAKSPYYQGEDTGKEKRPV